MHEHDCDAQRGLPEPLPPGERLLWQGSPDWRSLARRAFHARKLAAYFAVILALRGAFVLSAGSTVGAAIVAVLWLLPLVAAGLGIVLALAWLTSRNAVYTLTDKRVVMRIGIVLTVAFNLPLARIASAAVRVDRNGVGDIPLVLASGDRIAYLHLWPHARPWRVVRPEPMLRSVPKAAEVAALLGEAWSAATQRPLADPVRTAAPAVPVEPRRRGRASSPMIAAH
jgi:hypothetical protein